MSDYRSTSKRKNDEHRETLFGQALKLLGRLLRFSFKALVAAPVRWLWRATVWTVKVPFRALGWLLHGLYVLINGHVPEFETAREREIYRRVKRHYRRRNRFITHLFVFALVMGTVWISWIANLNNWASRWQEPYTGQVIGFTLVWGVFLLFHYVRLRMGEAEDAALETALEREYERETRSQPMYYEETETYYDDEARYPHLVDEADFEDFEERLRDLPKAKRRSSYS